MGEIRSAWAGHSATYKQQNRNWLSGKLRFKTAYLGGSLLTIVSSLAFKHLAIMHGGLSRSEEHTSELQSRI